MSTIHEQDTKIHTIKEMPEVAGTPTQELQAFASNPLDYIKSCGDRYGDIFKIPFSGDGSLMPTVVIGSPEAMQVLFSPGALKYFENKTIFAVDSILGGTQHVSSLDIVSHRRTKKLMMPHFHGKALQDKAQQIWSIAQAVSEPWADGEPFWVDQAMRTLAMEVMVQAVFGITSGQHYEPLKQLITEWLSWATSPEFSQALYVAELQKDEGSESPWGKHLNYLKQIDQILYGEISDRRANGSQGRPDILSVLISAEDEEGNCLSDVEIRDNLLLFLFAGHDNIHTALTWLLYAIHSNFRVLDNLRQELKTLGSHPDPLAVTQLSYLTATCKEVLRLWMGAPLSGARILNEPFDLLGYPLEAGTGLCPSFYLLHRQPDLYPEPEQFRPERFLEREYGSHEWAPFGGGHRLCLGYALAQMEMKLAIAVFLFQYTFERTENEIIHPIIEYMHVHPERDFQLRVVA